MSQHRTHLLCFIICGISSWGFSGCQSTSLVSFPVQKRPVSVFFKDQRLRLAINRALSGQYKGSLTLLILHGRVWIIGCVSTPQERELVRFIVQNTPHVTEVQDFMVIAPHAENSVKDTYISQKFQSALFFDGRIRSQNYHVTVFDRVLYIMGTATSESEKTMVFDRAKSFKVVNLVTDITVAPQKTADNQHSS